jgi:hypothetical protein
MSERRQSDAKAAPYSRLLLPQRERAEGRVLRNRIALGALLVGLAATAASAQQIVPIYPVVPAGFALPPYEVVALVRSTGLEPLSRPLRYGRTYGLRAVDPVAGQEFHVVVDARLGRVVRIVPILSPGLAMPVMPPPYVRLPYGVAAVPDGYGPTSRIAPQSPGAEKPAASSAPRTAPPAGPPLPRPRPKIATTRAPAMPAPPAAPDAPAAAQPAPAAAPIAATPSPLPVPEGKDVPAVTAPATMPPQDELDE